MKSNFLQFRVYSLTSQKADGNASDFYKYPRVDEIQTRSNPHKSRISLPPWTELLNPSTIRKPSSTNPSKNSPSSRNSNQNPQQPNPKSTDLNHGRFCSSDDKLCNRWCGNLRPEGNIWPNPLIFFSLLSLWILNSEIWHHMHTFEFLNFRCQTSFCRIPSTQNLSVLAHKPMKTPQIWSLVKQIGSLLWVKTSIWTSGPTA